VVDNRRIHLPENLSDLKNIMGPFQNLGNDDFYRVFEDHYRGSRELIKGRLSVYLPFIKPLLQAYPDAAAIDLGCGRGEWLEVLTSAGFQSVGVDLDQGMLRDCHDLGLQVMQGDAIVYLSALPDESQVVVSAIHVVEHIAFDQLRALVSQAIRALKPGGLLIMETPNPENIVVATRNFYLDPTHQRPIPPELLSFIPDYYGFSRVKILRLQESPEIVGRENISLNDVLSGVSPDYAVVAQKPADELVTTLLDECFAKEYGLTLDSISSRYDTRINERIAEAESRAQQSEARAQQSEARAQQEENRAQQFEARAKHLESLLKQKEYEANDWHEQVVQMHKSTSWRVTAPLRAVRRLLGGSRESRILSMLRDPTGHAIRYVVRRPKLKSFCLRLLSKFPRLLLRLRGIRTEQLLSDSFVMRQAIKIPRETSHMSIPGNAGAASLASNLELELSIDEILMRIRNELEQANGHN